MLLKDRDGIVCDFCGLTYKNQFVYYALETLKNRVVNNMRVAQNNAGFERDMCEQCYADLLEDVQSNIGKFRRGHIKCDLSKTYKSGTFNYHIIYFHKVSVDKDREPTMEVERRAMDLNVINRFDELVEKTEVIKKKTSNQGGWS